MINLRRSMSRRLESVNRQIQKELSQILLGQLPEEFGIITVNHVETTPDLRNCRIWLGIIDEKNKAEVMKLLLHDTPQIFEKLSKRLKIKYVPRLNFYVDKNAQSVERVEELLEKISHEK